MKTISAYLVGGAVRDELLGFPCKDKDWVVVGSSPEDMLTQGFTQVGADFPVFLHPNTNEEYALARTERKRGYGYHGFECNSSPEVTLEEDLLRRDLTINAMAKSPEGKLIDPYGGQQDLKNRQLRHVSDAFMEDPLRILRVARFAARLAPYGFTIAPATLTLMQKMEQAGETKHLVAERVWQETARALLENSPNTYFEVLRQTGSLATLFEELNALFGVPQPEKHHPEIDCGVHALMSLEQACELSKDLDVRFASLIHDLGKALTPSDILPSHHGHEKKGLKPIKALCKRLKAPKDVQVLALLVSEFHTHVHKAFELRSQTILKVLKKCDAFRRPERFTKILLCCQADAQGRTGFEDRPYPQAEYFKHAFMAAKGINIAEIRAKGLDGKELGEAIDRQRAAAIDAFRIQYQQDQENNPDA